MKKSLFVILMLIPVLVFAQKDSSVTNLPSFINWNDLDEQSKYNVLHPDTLAGAPRAIPCFNPIHYRNADGSLGMSMVLHPPTKKCEWYQRGHDFNTRTAIDQCGMITAIPAGYTLLWPGEKIEMTSYYDTIIKPMRIKKDTAELNLNKIRYVQAHGQLFEVNYGTKRGIEFQKLDKLKSKPTSKKKIQANKETVVVPANVKYFKADGLTFVITKTDIIQIR